jgi:hypothetical protein
MVANATSVAAGAPVELLDRLLGELSGTIPGEPA